MHRAITLFKPAFDFFVTLVLWIYFITGFLFFYVPVIFIQYFFTEDREAVFQRTTHYYVRFFLFLLRSLTPGLSIKVNHDVRKIKSSIVIANHKSYFDPILLISIFPKQKTIVKGVFFKIPFMGWLLKSSAYIPFVSGNNYNRFLTEHILNLPVFIAGGGNLFIFPEGRRSRDGNIGKFQKGAFSISFKYKLPIEVLYINNLDRVYTPGKFFINSCIDNTISVERLGIIEPGNLTTKEMREKALRFFNNRIEHNKL